MKPLKFKESNVVIAESQDEFVTIYGHDNPFEGTMTTGFKLSKEEIDQLIKSDGELFIKIKTGGGSIQPMMLSVIKEDLINVEVDKYVLRSVKSMLEYIEEDGTGTIAVVCPNASWERMIKEELFHKYKPIHYHYNEGKLKFINHVQDSKGIRMNKVLILNPSRNNPRFMEIMENISNRLV